MKYILRFVFVVQPCDPFEEALKLVKKTGIV
jgi:hypothetical protein